LSGKGRKGGREKEKNISKLTRFPYRDKTRQEVEKKATGGKRPERCGSDSLSTFSGVKKRKGENTAQGGKRKGGKRTSCSASLRVGREGEKKKRRSL